MLNQIKSMYQSIKNWFKNSESILVARVTAAGGFLLAAVDGIDWNSLLSLDLANIVHDKTVLISGLGIFFHGIISEAARRRNATDL